MTTCILLAGGLGTRLRQVLPGVPKCLAPVAGSPFLQLQMKNLALQGIDSFVLSLGYRADQVIEAARALRKSFRIAWVVEPRPLGTGGAALFAMHEAGLSEALIANADTFLDGDCTALLSPLDQGRGELIRLIAVPSLGHARSGGIVLKQDGKVERFVSKGAEGPGLINAGLYRIGRGAFATRRPGERFSLEADVIEELAGRGRVAAAVVDGTLADIGVAEDYFRFCEQFERSAESASNGGAARRGIPGR